MSLGVIGCHLVYVIRCHWVSLGVIGCHSLFLVWSDDAISGSGVGPSIELEVDVSVSAGMHHTLELET